MPFYDEKDLEGNKVEVGQKNANLPNPNFDTLSINNKVIDRNALHASIRGSSWLVEYYSQFLAGDDEPTMYQLDMPGYRQSYLRIRQLELKVTQPLDSHTYNTEAGEFEVTGTAIMYVNVIPNYGDVFIGEIADGRRALFVVNSAKPASYFLASAYEITYSIKDYLKSAHIADLDSKTVQSTTFVLDKFIKGGSGLIVDEFYAQYAELCDIREQIPEEFYREFYDREYKTFVIPSQPDLAYDPFLTRFIKRFMDQVRHPWVAEVHELNTGEGQRKPITTLFDAALEGDITILDRCVTQCGLVTSYSFPQVALLNTIRYSGIPLCVWPKPNPGKGFYHAIQKHEVMHDIHIGQNREMNRRLTADELFGPNESNFLIKGESDWLRWISAPEEKDQPYVFSKAFYENRRPGMSMLEIMFRKSVEGTFNTPRLVIKAFRDRVLWTDATRYYMLPILLYITNVCISNME